MTPGTVYWITGLSGAGKTTIATLLAARLRAHGRPALLLDGDTLRAIFAPEAKHSLDERLRLAMSYGRLCREVASQGVDVVCATVSMFNGARRWNRENIASYREVYLRVPIEELRRRDTKGLYRAVQEGAARDLVGVDIAAELPENPDITIDNIGASPEDAVNRIWKSCVRRAAGPTKPGICED